VSVIAPASIAASLAGSDDDIRVMVVDDAVVVRSLVARWLGQERGLKLVASLRNGREAVDRLEQADPDVVILDVDMPDLDGISTLPLLLKQKRDLVVIMASTLTRRNAEVSLKALSLGAADYVPKPETEGGVVTSAVFQRELIDKVRALGMRRRQRRLPLAQPRRPLAGPATRRLGGAIQRAGRWRLPEPLEPAEYPLRPFAPVAPRVLLIGASTGGPQALTRLIARFDAVSECAPILITQHMPPTFTTILAENLARACGKPVREAVDGEPVLAGTILIAPGGKHMRVTRRDGTAVIALDDGPPINFCKPAVDPLFASAADVWGAWNLAVILTGMGSDGAQGAAEIVAGGGSVIAQDEASSVIWGMPGAAVEAGVCSAVLPLEQIAPQVVRLFLGAKP
jgi:two-component system, chemotaxis family, protein-glutamate methylesterase/glutaminase